MGLFFLWLVLVIATSIITARKRGRRGWLMLPACAVVGAATVAAVSRLGGGEQMAIVAAFAVAVAALVWSLAARSSRQLAVMRGSYGGFKKCPYCAESVRIEATKCMHCGSELVRGAPPVGV